MKTISLLAICTLMLGCVATENATKIKKANRNSIYLADLSPKLITNFYAICKEQIGIKQDAQGKPININDTIYENGIMLHAPSKGVGELVYDLNGKYKLFNAVLLGAREKSSVIFKIYGDCEELYVSPVITYEMEPVDLSLDISDVNELKIELDKEKANTCDLAVLGDPELIK